MPCQATFDEFTIEEQIRQLIKRIVNRRVDVCNRPVVLVLTMRHESDHLAADGITDELRGVVAERLAAFRCVDTVEAQADGFLVCGQNVDGVAVHGLEDFVELRDDARLNSDGRLCFDDEIGGGDSGESWRLFCAASE